jgi:hypothetical protein
MRILTSAYACAPGRGSEPGAGWNRAMPVSRPHDVRVLLPEHEREAVEGLRAFARSHQTAPDAEYRLVGDGPARKRLTGIARRPGVSQCVRFRGELPRREALAKLAECDAPAHPSLDDSGGRVCPVAVAAGRPVDCLDAGGLPVGAQVPEPLRRCAASRGVTGKRTKSAGMRASK